MWWFHEKGGKCTVTKALVTCKINKHQLYFVWVKMADTYTKISVLHTIQDIILVKIPSFRFQIKVRPNDWINRLRQWFPMHNFIYVVIYIPLPSSFLHVVLRSLLIFKLKLKIAVVGQIRKELWRIARIVIII